MSAPQDVRDVLAGPHIKTLAHDGSMALVIAEPLRFIAVTLCRGCGRASGSECGLPRCPKRGAF